MRRDGHSAWFLGLWLAACLPSGQAPTTGGVGSGDSSAATGDDGTGDDGTGTGDDGTGDSGEVVYSGELSVDVEGNTDLVCFSISDLGSVYEFDLSNDVITWMDLLIGPEWSDACHVEEPAYWADDFDCAVAPYQSYGGDSGWSSTHPPAALRLDLETRWCLLGFYAEADGLPARGETIEVEVRSLGPDGVASGPCGGAWEYSHCACDDPAPASCP